MCIPLVKWTVQENTKLSHLTLHLPLHQGILQCEKHKFCNRTFTWLDIKKCISERQRFFFRWRWAEGEQYTKLWKIAQLGRISASKVHNILKRFRESGEFSGARNKDKINIRHVIRSVIFLLLGGTAVKTIIYWKQLFEIRHLYTFLWWRGMGLTDLLFKITFMYSYMQIVTKNVA